ncbi:hypothetical protein [Halobaculum sp. MBLA0143]|uniref:hypothetical protein n=1 Tax=Halobaculum sp. MBLA0143 TaxID=3079933 RepID=UPI003524E555
MSDDVTGGRDDVAPDGGADPVAEDESAAVAGESAAASPLAAVRGDRRRRWGVTLAAVAVGLGLAWVHWLGLVVGAALVATLQRSPGRGVAAGVGFGAVVVAVNVGLLAAAGAATLSAATAMTQVFAVSVAAPLAAGVVGGLVRVVV